MADVIDEELSKLLENAYTRAKEVLVRRRDVLDRLAQVLIKDETLEGPELEAVFGDGKAVATAPQRDAQAEASDVPAPNRQTTASGSELAPAGA